MEEIFIAISCLTIGFGARHYLPLLRRTKPPVHEHVFDHMNNDGLWRCQVCDEPKPQGS